MSRITIFGTGNMGTAIGTVFAAGGHSVEHIHTSTENPTVAGDIVVLAVPYAALASLAETYRASFAGRIVIDISNPVDFSTFDSLVVPADSSATAQLAEALPESRVVKAFNTTFAGTLASGSVGGNATTVLVAGDDADAKKTVADAIAASGAVAAIDAGSLARARELEALGLLQLTLAAAEKVSWVGGFAVVR